MKKKINQTRFSEKLDLYLTNEEGSQKCDVEWGDKNVARRVSACKKT